MNNVSNFEAARDRVLRARRDGVSGGPRPPDNNDMEPRVAALEAAVKTLATKEDVARLETSFHKEINAQTWKLVTFVCGFGTALVAITFFIAKHMP